MLLLLPDPIFWLILVLLDLLTITSFFIPCELSMDLLLFCLEWWSFEETLGHFSRLFPDAFLAFSFLILLTVLDVYCFNLLLLDVDPFWETDWILLTALIFWVFFLLEKRFFFTSWLFELKSLLFSMRLVFNGFLSEDFEMIFPIVVRGIFGSVKLLFEFVKASNDIFFLFLDFLTSFFLFGFFIHFPNLVVIFFELWVLLALAWVIFSRSLLGLAFLFPYLSKVIIILSLMSKFVSRLVTFKKNEGLFLQANSVDFFLVSLISLKLEKSFCFGSFFLTVDYSLKF